MSWEIKDGQVLWMRPPVGEGKKPRGMQPKVRMVGNSIVFWHGSEELMLPSVAEEAIRVKDGWFQKGVTVKLDGAQATYWFDLRQVIVAEPPSRAARMIAWHRGDQDGVIEDR